MPRNPFGAAFRAARERLGMSLRDVAVAADVDPSWLSRIESGTTDPSLTRAVRLAAALGISLDDIVGVKEKHVKKKSASPALRRALRLLDEAKRQIAEVENSID